MKHCERGIPLEKKEWGEKMNFAICLIIVVFLSFTCNQFIKKHANILYAASTLVALGVIAGTAMNVAGRMPLMVRNILWEPFAWGGFASAIFVVVMYAGAVQQGSVAQRKWMPIRAELSIIASILTLGHNLSAGQTYFVYLFTEPSKLQGSLLWATICTLLMLCIMLPLFITSFPKVRRKMQARNWKKLQRFAYAFYALIYIHVLLLYVPKAQMGNTKAIVNVAVFSVIFLVYGVMRIRKAMKNSTVAIKAVPVAAAVVICAAVSVMSMPKNNTNMDVNELSAENVMQEEAANSEDQNKQTEDEQAMTKEEEKDKESENETKEDTTKDDEKSSEKESETDKKEDAQKHADQSKEAQKASEPKQEKKETPAQQSQPKKEPAAAAPVSTGAAASEPPAEKPPAPAPEPPAPEPPAVTYKYQNGTFTGSGSGYNGNITVSVSIQNDVITGISVVSHSEDELFWADAQAIIGSIMSAQSTNVNTVSGATYSSSGIKQAVAAALSSAQN